MRVLTAVATGGMLLLCACGPKANRAVDAYESPATTQRLVIEGLLAQSQGLGGCDTITAVHTEREAYFPNVEFYRGVCLREHGDTAVHRVAIDSAGQIYLLDSPSSYRFLLRRHKPAGVDSTNAVKFALLSLQIMGEVAWDASPIQARDGWQGAGHEPPFQDAPVSHFVGQLGPGNSEVVIVAAGPDGWWRVVCAVPAGGGLGIVVLSRDFHPWKSEGG